MVLTPASSLLAVYPECIICCQLGHLSYSAALVAAGPLTLWRSKKMFVHHVLVVLCSIYAESLPFGYCNLLIVTFVLELGSCTFNLATIMPQNAFVMWGYQIVMGTGHIFALGCFAVVMTYDLEVPVKFAYGAIGVGVMIGRQLTAMKNWRKRGVVDSSHGKKA